MLPLHQGGPDRTGTGTSSRSAGPASVEGDGPIGRIAPPWHNLPHADPTCARHGHLITVASRRVTGTGDRPGMMGR